MGVSIERELADVERQITTLRVDYERFFTGDIKKAPLTVRKKLQDYMRRLSQYEVDKAAERFRLQALLSRFNALGELWDKRLAAREEGRAKIFRLENPVEMAKAQALRPADTPAPGSVKAKGRVDFTPLFDRYCAARRAQGEDVSKLRYERFEEQVRKQAEEIRRKTGAARLVFEVQVTDGRVRLVGRPAAPKGTT